MDIIVLIKQVPATESYIEIADDGKSVKTDNIKWVMNPYDEFAVEEALRIREAKEGSVTIVSVGPDKAVEAIRTGLAMGADKGVLVNDPAVMGCDALGIARILAAVIKDMPFDLIIAGWRAVDGDNSTVGPAVAEYLNIPNISMVTAVEIVEKGIRCSRDIEGGSAVIEAPFPALITAQRGLNEPRYTSMPGIMKAKKKPVDIKTAADIGIDAESLGKPGIKSLELPPERKAGRIIEGDSPQAKAAELVRALREESGIQ